MSKENVLQKIEDARTSGDKRLSLMSTELASIPDELWELTQLESLLLDGNNLTSLPTSIEQLKCLRVLDLRDNRLKSISESLAQLEELQVLNLSGNQLTEVSFGILQLKALRKLDLSRNKLSEIPESITQIDALEELNVKNNPLREPPIEIADRGIEAIRNYFASRSGEVLRPLNEVKVLFVGEGGAGKTSLVNRLLDKEFDPNENQTYGINIDPWKFVADGTPVTAHLWDFGGQVIMRATHQFFLSKRSLYVLVLDGRKEENPEYWLKHIESFGGDSPVLVVLNKIDEHPSFDVNRRFYKEKYPGIVGFYPISCARIQESGIPEFKRAFFDSLSTVEMLRTEWPEPWFAVKEKIEAMDDPFIGVDTYNDYCDDANIIGESSRNTLVQFLHDLGRIVHFPDFELHDTHVLDPKWLTAAVYAIINSKTLARNRGLLNLGSLESILGKVDGFVYPVSKHGFIVKLMKKFELCYAVDENTVLIPDLLEVPEPDFEFNVEEVLRFRLQYDFLPSSIMPRFIVRRHQDIKDELRWRTGVVLKAVGFQSTAVVRSDAAEKRITIEISGDDRRDYLAVIRSTLHDINGSFERLGVVETVPLPDNLDIVVPFEHLRMLQSEEVDDFFPQGVDKKYRVADLLGAVHGEQKWNEQELMDYLKSVASDQDTEETLTERLIQHVNVQWGAFGFSVNVKGIVMDFLAARKARKEAKSE